MKVLKFGGTSVGSAQNIQQVANILCNNNEDKIIVFSAMSGTTNALLYIVCLLSDSQTKGVSENISSLEQQYMQTIGQLFNSAYIKHANDIISEEFEILRDLCTSYSEANDNSKIILSRGEYISCRIIHLYLKSINRSARIINATDFIRTDKDGQPDYFYTEEKLRQLKELYSDDTLFITQGYVCIDPLGNITNLGRGGSDFTASIIGSAIDADLVEIWTDIDGLHNNDPRYVENTCPISELSYEEAEELAYFGAKILHPTCLFPLKLKGIPMRIKNTFKPELEGTLIHQNCIQDGFKSLASKDNIIAINIKSGRMMMAYGFLRKIFSIFEDYKCPVDMITTSEIAVSVTIDNHPQLDQIINQLEKLGEVNVYKNQSIICMVGAFAHNSQAFTSIINNSLSSIPLRMISYGASQNNICLLIDSEYKIEALNQINERVFNTQKEVA